MVTDHNYHNFPELKIMFSEGLFCPTNSTEPKDIRSSSDQLFDKFDSFNTSFVKTQTVDTRYINEHCAFKSK